MSEQKWQRSSLRHVADELAKAGYGVSHTTIGRLLKAMKYSLKANLKRLSGTSHPDREPQFAYIARQKAAFLAAGLPVISVDTKKKELIGNFKNPGQSWRQEPEMVNDHDFAQDALGKAVPYGIYDLCHNRGYVYVGESADTPEFAVDSIARWWLNEGQLLYPHANQLLILADAGGSNGCRPRLWKLQLQEQLADRLQLQVTVCPLSNRCLEMEPHRASSLWPHYYQLGCPAPALFRVHAGDDSRHRDRHRSPGQSFPRQALRDAEEIESSTTDGIVVEK